MTPKRLALIVAASLVMLIGAGIYRWSPAGSHPDASPLTDRTAEHRKRVALRLGARKPQGANQVAFTPSARAVRHFPNGKIVNSRGESLAADHFRRTEIIQTSLKYPFIRLETDFRREGTNEVLLRMSEMAADHVVVSLHPGVSEEQLIPAIAAVDGLILRKLGVDGAATYIVGLPEPTLDAVPAAIRTLSGFSAVVAEVDGDSVSRKALVPNDPYYGSLWHINNSGASGGLADADIDASDAWSLHTGSPNVLIAVSDTGVDYNHPDLKANLWTNVLERANTVDDDRNSYSDDLRGWNFYHGNNNVMDRDGHGTFVTGVIGGEGNNRVGVAGVAWKCKLLPVRSLDTDGGFASDIAEGFDYARKHGAHIVNASHGGGSSLVMKAAVDRLQAAGILLVAAAGNHTENIDITPLYPAAYTNENIISVAATDRDETLASFSSFGAVGVDLAAPGVDISSTGIGNSYEVYNGTSFATPQVSGVAALIKAKFPSLSATQIRTRILDNVDRLPTLTGKCATGGRLNAYRALLSKTTIAAALDRDFLDWSTGGAVPWIAGATPFAHDKVDAVQTGKIWNNQESVLQTTIHGPGTISFWWRVSSEATYDYLAFYIDGAQQGRISGKKDWALQTYSLPAGAHTITWKYVKDGSRAGGDDKGFVDQFVFKGFPPTITSQPVSQSATIGSTVSFSVEAGGPGPFGYQWKRNGVNLAGATDATLTLNPVKASHEGNYKVTVRNSGGTVVSAAATLTLCRSSVDVKEVVLRHPAASSSFGVTVSGTCPWTVETTNDWIHLDSPSSIDSSMNYQFSLLANETAFPRLGAISVGTNQVLIRQLGVAAPASLENRRFTLTITNSADQSVTNGSFLLVTRQGTNGNRFSLRSTKIAVASDEGTFSYAPIDTSSGYINLTGEQASELAVSFDTPTSGRFTFQQGSGPELVGTFRTLSGVGDLNEDGYTDLVWQTSDKKLNAWYLRGPTFIQSKGYGAGSPLPAGWKAVGAGELSSMGEIDIIVQGTSGQLASVPFTSPTDPFELSPLAEEAAVPTGSKLVSVGDFNQDGKQDLLLQGSNSRAIVHVMDGTNFVEAVALKNNASAGTGWRLVGSADFNDDASLDLLWQHSDGRLQVWHLVGTTFLSGKALKRPTPGWRAIGLGDFNNDARTDLLFQYTDRKLAIWTMNGNAFVRSQFVKNGQPAPVGWKLIAPK